jgi:hypothetical protein
MGQKAISGMLDEQLIEATQTLRALEDGDEEDFYPIEPSRPDDEEEEAEEFRPVKKAKTNGSGVLLDEDALDNLKYYAEMARKQAEEDRERASKRKVPAKAAGLGMLGGYGSESD